jgi:hypothetical protein
MKLFSNIAKGFLKKLSQIMLTLYLLNKFRFMIISLTIILEIFQMKLDK